MFLLSVVDHLSLLEQGCLIGRLFLLDMSLLDPPLSISRGSSEGLYFLKVHHVSN